MCFVTLSLHWVHVGVSNRNAAGSQAVGNKLQNSRAR